MFEVQHRMFGDHWENVWSHWDMDGDGEPWEKRGDGAPMYFDTRDDALCELAMFFEDVKDAVRLGDMPEDHGYRREDFRIVYIEPMAEAV